MTKGFIAGYFRNEPNFSKIEFSSVFTHNKQKNKNFNDYGTYHVTNDGETNWHAYASLISSEAMKLHLKVKCAPDKIHPILSSEYPTVAKRPFNSRLNTDKIKKTFMLELPHWESEVKKVLREVI